MLPDFINAHPDLCANWKVAFDARGHLTEPHTDHEFGLGTLEVDEYINGCKDPAITPATMKDAHVATFGPKGRYGGLVYIEKEGFQALFDAVQLAARHDLAIMSSKGMSVVAARKLAQAICHKYKIPLYVLHDFDKAGFSIIASFERSNRRFTYTEKFKVIDLGLRLDDVRAPINDRGDNLLEFAEDAPKGKHPEDSPKGKANREARAKNLRKNGATEQEVAFLLDQRVELNAFASDDFVAFIERKLTEHGVRKIVPNKTLLAQTYRAIAQTDLAKPGIEAAIAAAAKTSVAVPADLKEQVDACLDDKPHIPWDVAVAKIVRGT